MAVLAGAFVFVACDKNEEQNDTPDNPDNPGTNDLPKFDFPAYEDFPIEAGNLLAEGSDVGVTIEITRVEDYNFVFELRPGAMVQSFSLDVYPLANLYNTLLNNKNSGTLTPGSAVAVNERIREFIFTPGSGGYQFSINDFENPEDFLQIEYDWMNTSYAAASAIAIPDCDFLIAVVASTEPTISSANQTELTLCYVHTTKQPLVGKPEVEIEVRTGYNAFAVTHHLNADAAGVYYFGGQSTEVDDYINNFGDTMYRDFMRTLYSSPVLADNEEALTYSKFYGEAADHTIQSTTTAIAVDANLTPAENYVRRDFHLDEKPAEGDQDLAECRVTVIEERVAAGYFEFYVEMPKDCNTIFYGIYSEEDKLKWEGESSKNQKKEAIRLVNEGYGWHNPNFSWNKDAPEDERATGAASGKILRSYLCVDFAPGSTWYIGFTGRNGYGTAGPLMFSDPIVLDELNLSSPEGNNVRDLNLEVNNISRTSFNWDITYDPSTVSLIRVQWIPDLVWVSPESEEKAPWEELYGISVDSPWSEWIDMIYGVTGKYSAFAEQLNINIWKNNESGKDGFNWQGMDPGTEYTTFLVAEDFDGNVSDIQFVKVTTKDVQVGPDPTVNITIEDNDEGGKNAIFTMDHDVEYFKHAVTTDVSVLNITGANAGSLNDIANSGIDYETWYNAIYEWVAEYGMQTNYESTADNLESGKVNVVAAWAVGKKEDGSPAYKMTHLIVDKNGNARTLEEIFGK